MEFQQSWYLLALLLLSALTLFLFIKNTILFLTDFKYMLPAILFTGAIFMMLNVRFIKSGIIEFDVQYLCGKNIIGLPFEEWLWLLVISFFTFAVYLQVTARLPDFDKPFLFQVINVMLLIGFGFAVWFWRQKLVMFFVSFLLIIYFGYTVFRKRFQHHFSGFYISYCLVLVPFFLVRLLVNNLPVLIYSSAHVTGVSILNVPVEEFGYLFLLMLINITVFEYLRENQLY